MGQWGWGNEVIWRSYEVRTLLYISEFTLELQRRINTLEKGPDRVVLLRANAAWFREGGSAISDNLLSTSQCQPSV